MLNILNSSPHDFYCTVKAKFSVCVVVPEVAVTTTVYVPAGVPLVGVLELPPPPQLTTVRTQQIANTIQITDDNFTRRCLRERNPARNTIPTKTMPVCHR